MTKHLELQFGSIGEMISMLRYNDQLTVADLQRPINVIIDINTGGPIDGTYLHIAGPVNAKWLSSESNQTIIETPKEKTKTKSLAKQAIGFRRPDNDNNDVEETNETK